MKRGKRARTMSEWKIQILEKSSRYCGRIGKTESRERSIIKHIRYNAELLSRIVNGVFNGERQLRKSAAVSPGDPNGIEAMALTTRTPFNTRDAYL
jgi:hypothetical protein